MSNYINDALLDASPYKKQQEESKHLVNKWDKTGLLDGLNEDFQKNGMAVMLENQAKQLINENSGTGGTAGTGTATNAGSEEWSGVALPLVRRIFGELAAQDFVSVQPMNLPSGLVFYLDFKYGKSVEGYGTNSAPITDGKNVSSIGGKTGPNNPSGSSAPYGVGGLYGEGRYDYSMNQEITATLAGNATNYSSASATFKDINFNQEFSASLAKSELQVIKVAKSKFTNADFKAARSFNITGSNNISQSLPQFTTVDDAASGNVNFVVSSSGALSDLNGVAVSVLYTKQPTESVRGDFEDTTGNATQDTLAIPEVDLQLKSSAIVAKTRKLKAVWSPELAQDLNVI